MPLPRNVYDADLLIDGQVIEHRGIVLAHGDELRAELEGSKRAIPQLLPHTFTSLMLWAGCVRLGHYEGSYDEWRNGGLVEYRRVPQTELDAQTVDPTPAEPSGSASSSPATSPASSTGSTPTSTND
jgi:hypothetical protein